MFHMVVLTKVTYCHFEIAKYFNIFFKRKLNCDIFLPIAYHINGKFITLLLHFYSITTKFVFDVPCRGLHVAFCNIKNFNFNPRLNLLNKHFLLTRTTLWHKLADALKNYHNGTFGTFKFMYNVFNSITFRNMHRCIMIYVSF